MIEDQDTADRRRSTQEEPDHRRRDAQRQRRPDRDVALVPDARAGGRGPATRSCSSADDGDNPKTIKNYLVVLRGDGGGTSCPGTAPAIAHTPHDQTTRLDLTPTATVTDDKGLKDAPLFYYSTTNPGTTPDLSHDDAAVDDARPAATHTSGQYTATRAEPGRLGVPRARAQTIYYVFVADDDDDTMGSCDHSTTSQVYSMTVTAGGTDAPRASARRAPPTRSAATATSACTWARWAQSYCLQAAAAAARPATPARRTPSDSVDGAQATQCVPQSGSCEAPTGAVHGRHVGGQRHAAATRRANPTLDAGPLRPRQLPEHDEHDARERRLVQDRRRERLARRPPARRRRRDRPRPAPLSLGRHGGDRVDEPTTPTRRSTRASRRRPTTSRSTATATRAASTCSTTTTTAETCNTTCTDDANEDDDTYSQARATTYPTLRVDRQRDLPERRRLVQGHALRRRDDDGRPDVHAERPRPRTSTSTSTRTASTSGRAARTNPSTC